MGNINFKASMTQPNPLEVKYWVDLTADNQGGIIKYYNNSTKTWEPIQKLDMESGVTESKVNELISSYILHSYGRTINSLCEEFDSMINGVTEELKGYRVYDIIDNVDILTEQLEALTARVVELEKP